MFKNYIRLPQSGEYPAYSEIYMTLVPGDGLVLQHLQDNFIRIKDFILSLPEERLYHRYAEGKWSIKEILVHLIDDERIFAYRALRYARGDKTELPGFQQDDFAACSRADARSIGNIFEEYAAVRSSTIAMYNGFPEEAMMRSGTCEGYRRTVRAMAYHIAGHELWHFNIIRERYLS